MKKMFAILAALNCAVSLAACGSSSGGSGISSSKEYVDKIGGVIAITDIEDMAASMIGAEEGTSFKYNGNKFEIYQYKSGDPALAQAETGKMTISIGGFGDFDTFSSVNGNFVMMYDEKDDAVINAFDSFKE